MAAAGSGAEPSGNGLSTTSLIIMVTVVVVVGGMLAFLWWRRAALRDHWLRQQQGHGDLPAGTNLGAPESER